MIGETVPYIDDILPYVPVPYRDGDKVMAIIIHSSQGGEDLTYLVSVCHHSEELEYASEGCESSAHDHIVFSLELNLSRV